MHNSALLVKEIAHNALGEATTGGCIVYRLNSPGKLTTYLLDTWSVGNGNGDQELLLTQSYNAAMKKWKREKLASP